ncbi:MAG: hypothetical protein K2V38_12560 [Gemmataceae bacterium]|nr:hypothetical protein [Gemmataceae bacterium]
MAANPFDKVSRYAAKIDPSAFLSWALDLPADRFAFAGWLDTRAAPLPEEPDQAGAVGYGLCSFGRLRKHRLAHALGFKRGTIPAPSTLSEVLRDLDAEHSLVDRERSA